MPLESDWIKRFCPKLVTIQPMPEQAAIEIARRTYPDLPAELRPEEAAEIYAREEPPADVGAPSD